jgi:hypothetical protein
VLHHLIHILDHQHPLYRGQHRPWVFSRRTERPWASLNSPLNEPVELKARELLLLTRIDKSFVPSGDACDERGDWEED